MAHDTGSGQRAGRLFYCLVTSRTPDRAEFRSYYELGRVPANATPRQIDLSKGVSMFETAAQARALAKEMRRRYDYIAVVAIPGGVRAERQGKRAGHYNVHASPDALAGWVVDVMPVALE